MTKTESVFGSFAKYVSLNILGMLALSCYILADTLFVSLGLGPNGLTSLNLAIPVYNFIHGSGLMIGIGGATIYSIKKSRGDDNEANKVFTNSLYLAGIFALVFVLVGIFLSGTITALMGADEAVYDDTKTYMTVILLFSPAFIMNNVLLSFVRNDGAPQFSMAAMITGSLSNVLLDWVFIFPCNMGIFGAVFATGLAPLVSIGVMSVYFFQKKNKFKPVKTSPIPLVMGRSLSSGLPSLLTEVSSGVVIIVFNSIMLSLKGNEGVAAYGVIANISLVVIAIFTGIAQGIQPLISKFQGLCKKAEISLVVRYSLIAEIIFAVAVIVGVFLFNSQITAIFNSQNNRMLQQIAEEGMVIYFLGTIPVGINVILSMYFTSTENALPAHIISALRGFIIIIPAAFILSELFAETGVWTAFPFTEGLVMIFSFVMYFIAKRKNV